MKSLKNRYPEAIKKMQNAGFPAICEMASHFYRCSDMDRVLGYNGASNNWFNERTAPSKSSEERAKIYLDSLKGNKVFKNSVNEVPESPAVESDTTVVLMISIEKAKLSKIEKVLNMFNVEYVEID